MRATNVDLVFVIDASESMRPCFDGLARNLDQVVRPLQGFSFNVRLGLVSLRVGRSSGNAPVFYVETLIGGFESALKGSQRLFTQDGDQFAAKLRSVELGGDEHHLIALDFALDFPFGSISDTRRVVAMFSDERIEDGTVTADDLAKIPQIIQKITARKVQLFAALPLSPALEVLGSVEGAEIQAIDGGDGLASVNFGKMLGQMAKSISVYSSQGGEDGYKQALFGQDSWGTAEGSFSGLR
jgi:hypothetical protein